MVLNINPSLTDEYIKIASYISDDVVPLSLDKTIYLPFNHRSIKTIFHKEYI